MPHYKSEVLSFLDTLIRGGQKFCVLCLRTEKERRLVKSTKLTTFLEVVQPSASWFSKRIMTSDTCYVCNALISRALELMRAVNHSQRFLNLYDVLLQERERERLLQALDQFQPIQDTKQRMSVWLQPLPLLQHCQQNWEWMRAFSTVVVTDTLTITSKKACDTDVQPSTSSIEPRATQLESSPVLSRPHISGTAIEDNQFLIIENNIPPPAAPTIIKEEIDTVILDDDDEPMAVMDGTVIKKSPLERKRPRNETNKLPEQKSITLSNPKHVILPNNPIISMLPNNSATILPYDNKLTIKTNLQLNDMIILPDNTNLNTYVLPNQNKTNIINIQDKAMTIHPVGEQNNKDLNVLHPIYLGPDNIQYVPSISSKIVNNQLSFIPRDQMPAFIRRISNPQVLMNTEQAPTKFVHVSLNQTGSQQIQILEKKLTQIPQPWERKIAPKPLDGNQIRKIVIKNTTSKANVEVPSQGNTNTPNLQPIFVKTPYDINSQAILSPKANEINETEAAVSSILPDVIMNSTIPQLDQNLLEEILANAVSKFVTTNHNKDKDNADENIIQVAPKTNRNITNIGINEIGVNLEEKLAPNNIGPQPIMKKTVDWESKIPMDVICNADAEEPTFLKRRHEQDLGLISSVYSEASDGPADKKCNIQDAVIEID